MTNYTPIITGTDQLESGTIERKRRKVTIVGFAPSTMRDVQHLWDDEDMEIWGLNQLHIVFPALVEKCTRWWQIHHKHTYNANAERDVNHHAWMSEQKNFPIYMMKKEPDIPMSVEFPVDIILSNFRRYFTNSISWEIAMVIYETLLDRQQTGDPSAGFTDCHIVGVDMATDGEYSFERPSVEYFIGMAEGVGIKMHIPEKSDLLKSMWLYPFEDSSPMKIKMGSRRAELRERINNLGGQEQMIRDNRNQLIGAIENMNYVEKCWTNIAKEMITGK